MQDLLYRTFQETWRSLKSQRRDMSLTLAIFAIGISSAIATLSVVDTTILRPLPYSQSDAIVEFGQRLKTESRSRYFTYRFFSDAQGRLLGLRTLAALSFPSLIIYNGRTSALAVDAIACSSSLFDLLGISPLSGRTFTREEEQEFLNPSVVLISEQLWRSHYAADAHIIGQEIWLNQRPFVVIGIMPKGLRIPPLQTEPSVWIPLASDPMIAQLKKMFPSSWDRSEYLSLWGRLDPALPPPVAAEEIKANSLRLLARDDDDYSVDTMLKLTGVASRLRSEYRIETYFLALAGLLTLIVSCSNASSILVARAVGKRQDIAVRQALGEPRWETAVRLMAEPLLASLFGWLVAVPLAILMLRGLQRRLPGGFLPFSDLLLSTKAILVVLVVSAASTIGLCALPAWRLAASRYSMGLGSSRSVTEGLAARITRKTIVVVQIACATVVVMLLLSLLRAYYTASAIRLGFAPEGVLSVHLTLPQDALSGHRWKQLANSMASRLAEEPGIETTTVALAEPLTRSLRTSYNLLGKHAHEDPAIADYRPVGPAYFSLLHIPVRRGRAFLVSDSSAAPPVCIINETLAQSRLLPGDELNTRVAPLGMSGMSACQVIGVAGDVASSDIKNHPQPAIYVPMDQMPDEAVQNSMIILVRTKSSSQEKSDYTAGRVGDTVRQLAPTLPVEIRPLTSIVQSHLAPERFTALLMGFVNLVVVILAACSVYGITANYIAQGRRALTIRLAVGATIPRLIGSTLQAALRLSIFGLAAGLLAAYYLIQILRGFLMGVAASEHIAHAFICAGLIVLIVCASAYTAARSLMNLDTADVLKEL